MTPKRQRIRRDSSGRVIHRVNKSVEKRMFRLFREGCDIPEIASAVGFDPRTVRARLERAGIIIRDCPNEGEILSALQDWQEQVPEPDLVGLLESWDHRFMSSSGLMNIARRLDLSTGQSSELSSDSADPLIQTVAPHSIVASPAFA